MAQNKENLKFPGIPLNYDHDFWICPRALDDYWRVLNKSECKLLICILRKIIGWEKQKKQGWDYISQSQFIKYTGLAKGSVKSGIKGLAEKGFIKIDEVNKRWDGTLKYELVMSGDSDKGGLKIDKTDQILNNEGPKNDQEGSNIEHLESKSEQTINTNNKQLDINKIIGKLFSYYQKNINKDFELTSEVKKLIEARLEEFDYQPKKLAIAIQRFSWNEWSMDNCASLGPKWFFASKNRLAGFMVLKNDQGPERNLNFVN